MTTKVGEKQQVANVLNIASLVGSMLPSQQLDLYSSLIAKQKSKAAMIRPGANEGNQDESTSSLDRKRSCDSEHDDHPEAKRVRNDSESPFGSPSGSSGSKDVDRGEMESASKDTQRIVELSVSQMTRFEPSLESLSEADKVRMMGMIPQEQQLQDAKSFLPSREQLNNSTSQSISPAINQIRAAEVPTLGYSPSAIERFLQQQGGGGASASAMMGAAGSAAGFGGARSFFQQPANALIGADHAGISGIGKQFPPSAMIFHRNAAMGAFGGQGNPTMGHLGGQGNGGAGLGFPGMLFQRGISSELGAADARLLQQNIMFRQQQQQQQQQQLAGGISQLDVRSLLQAPQAGLMDRHQVHPFGTSNRDAEMRRLIGGMEGAQPTTQDQANLLRSLGGNQSLVNNQAYFNHIMNPLSHIPLQHNPSGLMDARLAHRATSESPVPNTKQLQILGMQAPPTKQTTNSGDRQDCFQLSLPRDEERLSDYQCLVRKQIQVFAAGPDDVDSHAQGRNKPIVLGQVGIRCRHCAGVSSHHRGRGSTYYPSKLLGLYQAAQNMASCHLCESCRSIPEPLKQELNVLRERKSSAGGGKQYWADGAKALGLVEMEDRLRFQHQLE